MMRYLVAIGLLFALLVGGIAVQRLYRRFAARHPELGPFREGEGCADGGGCASSCTPSRRD